MPKVYDGDCPYIFACYAHADRDAVLPIIAALADEGYRVWYDDGIELASEYPEYIANHVFDCCCLIMFVSCASLKSKWCKQEVNYAIDLDKAVLPVYLKDVELTRDLQMRMGHAQALYWYAFDSDEAFYKRLFEPSVLDSCLTDDGKRLRQTKSILIQEARKVLDASKCSRKALEDVFVRLRTLSKSLPRRDEEVEQPVHRLKERIERMEDTPLPIPDFPPREDSVRKTHQSIAIRTVIAIASVLMSTMIVLVVPRIIGDLGHNVQRKTSDSASVNSAEAVVLSNDSARHDALVDGVKPKSALNGYSWDELKQLASAIAKAPDDEWLAIAKTYNLMDEDGKLRGNKKDFKLSGDTETSVRILGFRHDELVDGGRAGITFEFAGAPVTHYMNQNRDNAGGWKESEMRKWLDSEFWDCLPPELQSCIETVKKETNNVGRIESEDDTSVVSSTDDRLWLLSASEVYGHINDGVWSSATYDAEGIQYQLYADKSVTAKTYDFCKKSGAGSWWWLRSPFALDTDWFRLVNRDGAWGRDGADYEWGVSPGFCF